MVSMVFICYASSGQSPEEIVISVVRVINVVRRPAEGYKSCKSYKCYKSCPPSDGGL